MEKKNYRYVIFDADHTLLDFDADERRAFRAAFAAAGRAADGDIIEECWAFSARNWNDLGLNDVHLPAVQTAYHGLYYDHVRALFSHIDREYGLNGNRAAAESAFMRALRLPSIPVAGAIEVVRALGEKYKLCVATNGLSEMQPERLKTFEPYLFRTFISEEMGAIKPSAEFFRTVFNALSARAEECIMVGDSLSSDVAGANAAGMDCIWFNRRGASLPPNLKVIAEISDLAELNKLL